MKTVTNQAGKKFGRLLVIEQAPCHIYPSVHGVCSYSNVGRGNSVLLLLVKKTK